AHGRRRRSRQARRSHVHPVPPAARAAHCTHAMNRSATVRIDSFDLQPGRIIGRKYEVVEFLGMGWEGEVDKIVERSTGIERAAKLFFPQRNRRDRAAKLYARKLHKLRHCPIVIQYHTREELIWRRVPITVLISEYVEGEKLSDFVRRQPGQR